MLGSPSLCLLREAQHYKSDLTRLTPSPRQQAILCSSVQITKLRLKRTSCQAECQYRGDGINGKLKAAVHKLFVSCDSQVRLVEGDSIDFWLCRTFYLAKWNKKIISAGPGSRVKRSLNIKYGFITFVLPQPLSSQLPRVAEATFWFTAASLKKKPSRSLLNKSPLLGH